MAEPIKRFSGSLFACHSDFIAHLRQRIAEAKPDLHLVYLGLRDNWVKDAWDLLEQRQEGSFRETYNAVTGIFSLKIRQTLIHDCYQEWNQWTMSKWVENGLISWDEHRYLTSRFGTTLEFNSGPYKGSRKEPDLFIRPGNHPLPTLVMESGWSESIAEMEGDKDLLLIGGNGDVQTGFVLIWRKHNDNCHVSRSIEVYTLDSNGMPVQRGETLTISPRTPDSQSQVITVTRSQLTLGHSTQNPNDTFEYRLDDLRIAATEALVLMGLIPA